MTHGNVSPPIERLNNVLTRCVVYFYLRDFSASYLERDFFSFFSVWELQFLRPGNLDSAGLSIFLPPFGGVCSLAAYIFFYFQGACFSVTKAPEGGWDPLNLCNATFSTPPAVLKPAEGGFVLFLTLRWGSRVVKD